MPGELRRADVRAVLVSLLLVLLIADAVAGSVLAWERRDRQRALDDGLRPASTAVTELLKAYVDQETGLRGFVLTGREEFLEPYVSGLEQERSRSARLRVLLRDEPALLVGLDEVLDRGRQWRRNAAEPEIAARRAGDGQAALRIVGSGVGKRHFDRVRIAAADLQTAVDTRAETVNRRSLRTADTANAVVVSSAVLALLLAGALSTSVQSRVLGPVRRLRRSVEQAADDPRTGTVTVPSQADPDVQAVGRSAERLRARAVSSDRSAVRAQQALTQEAPTVSALVDELTPSDVPLPGGLVAAGRTVPADGLVAGDVFEVVALGTDRVAVLVADASGHGPDAALLAMKARHTLVGALREHLEPGSALGRLAVDLGEAAATSLTVFVAVIDLPSAAVRYASAGHPPAAVLAAGGADQEQTLAATGPQLGTVRGTWGTRAASLPPGALLAVWTDATPETSRAVAGEDGGAGAREAQDAAAGGHRLRTVLREALRSSVGEGAPLDVAGLVRRALAETASGAGAGAGADDRTLLLLHRPVRAGAGSAWHELPAAPGSASAARRLLRAAVSTSAAVPPGAVVDAAELCLTELVTNALLHAGGGGLAVSVSVEASALCLAVRDGSPELPRLRPHSAEATTGRGMGLVDQLSARWGTEPDGGLGKVVWCEVDQASATRQPHADPDLELDLDLWPDLDDAPPADARRRVVRLLRYPLRLGLRACEHHAATLREHQLLLLSAVGPLSPRSSAPSSVLHLVHSLATDEAAWAHAPAGAAWDRRATAATDVAVALDEAVLREHEDVLGPAPTYADEPPDGEADGGGGADQPRDRARADLDTWVLAELRRQLQGAGATPWNGPLG